MNPLGKLEQLLLAGEISEDEYKKRKAAYVDTVLEMYVMGIISIEEMYKRLNQ